MNDYRWEMLEALADLIKLIDHPQALDEDTKDERLARARDAVARGEEAKRIEMDRFF